MTSIYTYNPSVIYKAMVYNPPLIDFKSPQKVYYNTKQFIEIQYNDIFSAYKVIPYKDPISIGDSWAVDYDKLTKLRRVGYTDFSEYFLYFRCQLNFAMHCATTALGISHEHLTQGSPLLKSFYRFHVMYHLRRVLYLLGSPIPRRS